MTIKGKDGGELAITPNMVMKYGGAIVGGIVMLVTLVMYVGNLNTHLTTHDLEIKGNEAAIKSVDDASVLRHNTQEKEIDKLNVRADQSLRDVSDIKAQIGVIGVKMDQLTRSQQELIDLVKKQQSK